MSSVSGWAPRRLNELASYINGYAFKPEDWGKDGLPIIRIEQLKNPLASTDFFAGKIPEKLVIQNGDLLFSWSASLFLKIWQHGTAALNQHLFKVLEKEGVDRFFLKAFIEFYLPELTAASHGSTMKHITRKELERFSALFPASFGEQKTIAQILSSVDLAIEQTEALIAKQQRIKTGLMQDLLTRGIDEHGQLRNEQTHAFKYSPLGRIPVEWEIATLGSVADISAGITLGKNHEGPDTVELPYLRVANVQDGFIDLSELKTIRIPKNHLEKYALEVGDVLMNEGGDFDKLGRGAVWEGQVPVCMHQNHVFKVRPHKNKLVSDFLAAVSASPYGKSFFMMASKQSTNLASINSTQLKAFPLPLPPHDEQIRIQSHFRRLDGALQGSQAELKKQKSLKTALMQDLLTGRKRVNGLLHSEVSA